MRASHDHDHLGVNTRMDGTGTNEAASAMTGADTPSQQFSITPSFEHLDDVRSAVRAILDGADPDIDALYLIAVSEVVTNAIEEHHRTDTLDEIDITVDADRRTVDIADRGNGYDPAERIARRNVVDGGFGLDLAEAGAPHLSWRHNPESGTTFTLPLPPAADADETP